jgi:hypothetical protein
MDWDNLSISPHDYVVRLFACAYSFTNCWTYRTWSLPMIMELLIVLRPSTVTRYSSHIKPLTLLILKWIQCCKSQLKDSSLISKGTKWSQSCISKRQSRKAWSIVLALWLTTIKNIVTVVPGLNKHATLTLSARYKIKLDQTTTIYCYVFEKLQLQLPLCYAFHIYTMCIKIFH